jgi:hypothetical protein
MNKKINQTGKYFFYEVLLLGNKINQNCALSNYAQTERP